MNDDILSKEGWKGEELPVGAQGVLVTRYFSRAVEVMTGNMLRLRDDMRGLLNRSDNPLEISRAMEQNPLYAAVISLIADREDENDAIFRLNARDLFYEVRQANAQALLNLSIAMWVADGAELPQEIIDLAKRQQQQDDLDQLDEEE